MADSKRNDAAGKVATPKTGGGPPATSPLPDIHEAIAKAIGAQYVANLVEMAAMIVGRIQGTNIQPQHQGHHYRTGLQHLRRQPLHRRPHLEPAGA